MARFRTLVAPCGEHFSPDGRITITPQRVRGWVDKFAQLKAQGVSIPVSWGHLSTAVPSYSSEDEFQEATARGIAGYAVSLYVDPATGGLGAELDVPGAEIGDAGELCHWYRMPDGVERKGAIKETSAAIHRWTDGRGKVWDDVPIHIALTGLPVIPNPTGFQKLSTLRGKPGGPVYLNTLTLASRRTSVGDSLFDADSDTEIDEIEAPVVEGIRLATRLARTCDDPYSRMVRRIDAEKWKRTVKARLKDLVSKGLNPNLATGVWDAVRGEQGLRRLSTLSSADETRRRVEKTLRKWQYEFGGKQQDAARLPLSREQREIVDAISTPTRPR